MKQRQPIKAYARATSSAQRTTNSVWTAGYEGNDKMPDTWRYRGRLLQPSPPLSPKSLPFKEVTDGKPAKNALLMAGRTIQQLFKGCKSAAKMAKGIAANDPLHAPYVNDAAAHTVKQEQQEQPSLPVSPESSVINACEWLHSRLTRQATSAEDTKTNKTNKDGYRTHHHHESEVQQQRPSYGEYEKYEETPAPAIAEVAEHKRFQQTSATSFTDLEQSIPRGPTYSFQSGDQQNGGHTSNKPHRGHDEDIRQTRHVPYPAQKRYQRYVPYKSCQPNKMTYQSDPPHHHYGRQDPHHNVQNPGRGNASRQDHRRGEEYVFRNPKIENQNHSNANYLRHQGGVNNQQPAAAPFFNNPLQHETLPQIVGGYNSKNVNIGNGEAMTSSHQAHVSNYRGVSHINDQERGWRAHTIQKRDQHQETHDNRRGGIQYDDQYYNRMKSEQRHHERQYEGKEYGEGTYERRQYEGKYYEERKLYQPDYDGKYYGAKQYSFEQKHDLQEGYVRNDSEVSKPDKQYGGHHYKAGEYTSEKKNVEPKDNEKHCGGGYEEKWSHGENIYGENEHTQHSGPKAEEIRQLERESITKQGPMFGTFIPQITTGRRSQIANTVNAQRTGSPGSHAKTRYKHDLPPFRLRYYPEHMRPLEHYSCQDETPSANWSVRGRESTVANSPFVVNTAPQDPFGVGHCELPKRGGPNGGHVYGRAVKEPTPGPAPEMGSLFQATRGEKRQRDEPEVWGGIKVSRFEWDGRAVGKDAQGGEFVFGTREQIKWQG
ncbi:hypothetical protein L211DRAFT_845786 [Terfezia boudieri ATCC MYA-4762]|uniref:Uncharacterized protein n=1 Tax=Terfezia boudieri ATCC MYA-4762 TaxID=1051890 RepID=A0A3N4LXY9_9PEZI|nr:hypothetical protein L211DRAFT_845786 [Terfezia boudieri ATCC MYA-4762]